MLRLLYGEPQVDRAIAFETQMDEARHAAEHANGAHAGMQMSDEEEPELVSRAMQAGLGLFVAAWSTALPLVACSALLLPSPMGASRRSCATGPFSSDGSRWLSLPFISFPI